MARPFKCRRIQGDPEVHYFKPRGVPVTALKEVILTVDEFEAVRLAHLEGLYQEQAAEKMEVSRQTFGNILNSAHKKIAECIVHGKALRIEGGVYTMDAKRTFKCGACDHEWSIPYGIGRPSECPQCACKEIHRSPQERGYATNNKGIRRRQHGRCIS